MTIHCTRTNIPRDVLIISVPGMTSSHTLAVKYVLYSTTYQLSSWLTSTSTVALVLVTRVRIVFAHDFSITIFCMIYSESVTGLWLA